MIKKILLEVEVLRYWPTATITSERGLGPYAVEEDFQLRRVRIYIYEFTTPSCRIEL